jgi:signal transduction histidine kinase/PAS domain-containing protein
MKDVMKNKVPKPYMRSNNHSITEVNTLFVALTGFLPEEMVGKSLTEAGQILRTYDQVDLDNIRDTFRGYIFTKTLEPIEVTIKVDKINDIKTFYFKKYSNSLINEKFEFAKQFYTDNKTRVSLFTYPGLLLLKANDNHFYIEEFPYLDRLKDYNIGRKMEYRIFPKDNEYGKEFWSNLINQNKTAYVEECEEIRANNIIYWNISIVPITIKGKIKYILQAMLDVTEKVLSRRFMEEQSNIIKQQNDELETIIENISDGLIIFDKVGNLTKFNKSARDKLSGKKAIATLGDCFESAQFYNSEGKALGSKGSPVPSILNGETISEYRMQIKILDETKWLEVNGTPVYDSRGNYITGILCFRDITEKIKNQEMLLIKAQYEMVNKIIENLALAVLRLTYPDGRIIDMNQKLIKVVKKRIPNLESIQEITGKLIGDVFPEEEAKGILEDFCSISENNSQSFIRNRHYIFDGEEEYRKVIYQPVFGLNSEILEVAMISFDVTQELKAKDQMEKNLKMQEEMFANISHELKTPLNVIFSIAQLFEYYLLNNLIEKNIDKVSKNTGIMKQNCYRLTKLISNIVDMSKIEAGFLDLNLSNVNIVYTVEEIVQSVAEYVQSKGLNIIFDTEMEEKIIACDPDKIERIILNLISNAIKFSDPGNEILVNVMDKGNRIEISVKDHGIGIEKKDVDTIFERFQQAGKASTRNFRGSGIGLCLVKAITELHGGQVSVKSIPGLGSTFYIELPAVTVKEAYNTIDIAKVSMKTDILKSFRSEEEINRKCEMIHVEFSDIYEI